MRKEHLLWATFMIALCLFCFVSFADAGIELVTLQEGPMFPGETFVFGINSFNETENFRVYLNIIHFGHGFNVELWDGRTQQMVSSISYFIPAPVFVQYTVGTPILGPAAGNMGTFNGPFAIGDGVWIEFTRQQSIGFAPNGLIGSVDLTIVDIIPEPTTLLLLGLGGFFITKKVRTQ